MINLVAILFGVSFGMTDPIFPVFTKNVINNVDFTQLGIIGTVGIIPYASIPLVVGFMLYKYNNGVLLSIGTVLNMLSMLLLSSSHITEFWHILVLVFVMGVGFAFFWPPCNNIISNVSKNHKDSIKNRVIFNGTFTAGMVIGPLLGSLILSNVVIDEVGIIYRDIFRISAFILGTAIIFSIILSKEHVHAARFRPSLSSLKWIKKFPTMTAIILYCSACYGIILHTHPAYIYQQDIIPHQIEILFFVFGVARIVALFNANRLIQKSDLTIVIATFTIVAGMVLSYFAGEASTGEGFAMFVVSMLFLGFGISIYLPLALEIILSRTAKSLQTVVIGTYEVIIGVGWILGTVTAGSISDIDDKLPYLLFFGIGVVIMLISILKRRTLRISAPK